MDFKKALFVNVFGGLLTVIILFVIKSLYGIYSSSQGEFSLNFSQMLFLVIVVFIGVNIALWGVAAWSNTPDQAKKVLKNIANGHREDNMSIWGLGKHISAGTVQPNHTWQEWINGLIVATNRPDLEAHNFGDSFYLFDLSTGGEFSFPKEKAARATIIGNSIPPGRVLWVMPKDT